MLNIYVTGEHTHHIPTRGITRSPIESNAYIIPTGAARPAADAFRWNAFGHGPTKVRVWNETSRCVHSDINVFGNAERCARGAGKRRGST